ncbi:MAG: hypothetical protein IPG33_12825 [Betaproteobacteria bacterium]|nr:hypothetical protein [Betaproteobacteria bacterium]
MEGKPPLSDAWPLSVSIIASLAVSAVIGLANVVHVLGLTGGSIGGRLLAVLPIYFLAAFVVAQLVFWLMRGLVGLVAGQFSASTDAAGLGARGHGVVVLLTFAAAGLLQYAETTGVQRVLQEQAASPAAHGGSCPPGMACTPLRSADELNEADAATRRAAAERGLLTAEGFALLLRDPDPAVRATLARRADLPQELLERMAGDRHPAVREAVAGVLRLSDEALSRLAFDREERVRLAVARNRNAPPTALEVLASSSSAEIRLLVAEHPRASDPVLLRLLHGNADRAEQVARERLPGGDKAGR